MSKSFIFVYNAKSGLKNSIMGGFHKIISPSTYNCNLCSITYGYFNKKKKWDTFLKENDFDIQFLYKDEWENKYNRKIILPAVLLCNNEELDIYIPAEDLNVMTLEELIRRLEETKL